MQQYKPIVADEQRFFKALGQHITNGHPHRFCDTFATELLQVGRVSKLLGHQSVRITEKHYAPWTESRQRQIKEDLRRAWEYDPVVLLEQGPTPVLRGEKVN
jgi:integrase